MISEFQHIPNEVWKLLEAVAEERLTRQQAQRLEKLVLSNNSVRRLYVEYIALHGTLHWDTAISAEFPVGPEHQHSDTPPDETDVRTVAAPRTTPRNAERRKWIGWVATGICACLLVLTGAVVHRQFFADSRDAGNRKKDEKLAKKTGSAADSRTNDENKTANFRNDRLPPKRRPNELTLPRKKIVKRRTPLKGRQPLVARRPRKPPFQVPVGGSSLEEVVAFVDSRLQLHWKQEDVEPSQTVSDEEWVRRAHLDLIGRIPTADEVDQFLKDDSPDKRRLLIDRLLDEPRYVRHFATVWSNLLVGREPSKDVNRPALEKFLRDSFARNRSWKEIVAELISAEGSADENGAANFLIAHLNNQAVPATAVTARLFLGMQVQCTQCHHHPFNKWKQNQFWELNGFFKQTATVRKKSKTGRRAIVVLINRKTGGPTYYDTRDELRLATFPKFGKTKIDPDPTVNRRSELARLMFEDENHQVARAFSNRMWAQFLGHGFTPSVDDMGPHNPATHPELLERLTNEFVASGYDVKRLIRWICNSRAYQLTSRFNETNRDDSPAKGHLPLFSRMYVKPMSAEQLYDSLLVATKAELAAKGNWDDVERRRRVWLRQFVQANQTEENDETTTFDGTIPQALLMMNSALVREAISGKPGTYLHEVLSSPLSDSAKIRKLCLAALSREPTKSETAAFRKLLRKPAPRTRRRQVRAQTLQDIFWAYLNSNEFILIH